MSEEMNLVRDLALILISAGIFTIISKALKQPLILGYIIAGFLIGPNISFFPGISSTEAVNEWSEIGIVFLMFGLGLEFSFKKLMAVGSSAIVTASTKFLGVFVIGFVVGQALGWSTMECTFLAGLLSMSSTMVVIKSYDDMKLKDKPWAGMVFGTLVVEDLIAILLMVLLSTMAVSQKFEGGEMLMNIAKLVFFLILWFLVGIYLIPTVLKKAREYINDEILLIVSIGLCFGMVSLATAVGFSSALGAFVMGSILAETVESEHIMKIVEPIKNLFGAIFFVSVGMMVAPAQIAAHWPVILLLAVVVIITHIIFSATGIILTGNGLKNGVYTGFSLAQLGEFGFIIAGVGVSLGVMRDFIYPVIIAVSVITTFTTPYMIKLAGPTYNFLEKKLPAKWLKHLDQEKANTRQTAVEQSEWKKLLSSYLTRILLYGVILIAIFIGSRLYLDPLVTMLLPSIGGTLKSTIEAGVTLVLMAPFLYGLGVNSGSIKTSAPKLIKEKSSNIWPILGLTLLRSFLVIAFVLTVVSSYFNLAGWAVVAVIIGVLAFIFFARRSLHKFSFFENKFLSNYNEKEEFEKKRKPVAHSVRQNLSDYGVDTVSIKVSQDSSLAGQKLKDIPFRSESGANIIKISRGKKSIVIPSGDVMLFPGDYLLAVGTSEQIGKLKAMIDSSVVSDKDSVSDSSDFQIKQIVLDEDSFMTGQTLRKIELRRYNCMVISVLHSGKIITNPEPDFMFTTGDTVWLAGNISNLGWA